MLKINFLGDSITEGCGSSSPSKCYVSLVEKMLPCEVRNYGISGTRIAKNISESLDPRTDLFFGDRVKDMNHDADYVFVFGGTNDYGHGDAPFGSFGDTNPETFFGGIDYLIRNLLKFYKQNQIIFILPLYRENENNPYGDGSKILPGKTLSEYREAMLKVLQKYDIKVLDIKDKVGKGENNPFLVDGLHPNDKGHQLIATLICEYIKKLK